MADYYVENFNITTEEDEHYEAQVKDPEAVEKSEGELLDTVVSFDNATGDSISSFTDFISNFVSGTKIGRWFKNFYAGCQYILHVGSLVNNCVTDNANLPLSAAQGKVLMDELTEVKSDLTELEDNDPMSSTGTVIPEYSDLNDYSDFGKYVCTGQSIAETYENCPYVSSFSLYVLRQVRTSILQVLVSQNNSTFYYRVYDSTQNNWRDWRSINITVVS